MPKPMKSITYVRLMRIEQWREARYRRALRSGDFATAKLATDLYMQALARMHGNAPSTIQTYGDYN